MVNASSQAAAAGAAAGAVIGLPFGPKAMTFTATAMGGVGAVMGGMAGFEISWREQEMKKIKEDMENQRLEIVKAWDRARKAEQEDPNFVGPIRPEKPVLEI